MGHVGTDRGDTRRKKTLGSSRVQGKARQDAFSRRMDPTHVSRVGQQSETCLSAGWPNRKGRILGSALPMFNLPLPCSNGDLCSQIAAASWTRLVCCDTFGRIAF